MKKRLEKHLGKRIALFAILSFFLVIIVLGLFFSVNYLQDYYFLTNKENKLIESLTSYQEELLDTFADIIGTNQTPQVPLIILHGHSSRSFGSLYLSLETIDPMYQQFIEDEYYVGKGLLLPFDNQTLLRKNVWAGEKSVVVKTTYYVTSIDELLDQQIGVSDQDRIINYSQRLERIIDIVLYKTGAEQVDIVAHSMGGLVARGYVELLSDGSKVRKLVMIGTPNHGFEGVFLDGFCDRLHPGPECSDMRARSKFLRILNNQTPTNNVEYYTIAGSCCKTYGQPYTTDEIITVPSVKLEWATNTVVKGNSVFGIGSFHNQMMLPRQTPQVYNHTLQYLEVIS
ncbi:alpha/beta fold hydrolase [Candidatus Woesearchaeota archaeon]|nr:alpha/beta fold hydrolase [Candidatus Woesearchaeota archaeon]